MAKKNLPNIPLYIGDWEKDCNVLSLEAEAGWLRIIFKMFTNGKQSTYKIPTKGLQNLWRCSEEKMNEILMEFSDYNICEMNRDGRFIEFTSRRFQKENEISEVRKDAVSKRKDRTKPLQKTYKKSTKEVQSTDFDNDNENESVIESKVKSEEKIKTPFDSKIFKSQWDLYKIFRKKKHKFSFLNVDSENRALSELKNLSGNDEKTAIKIIQQSIDKGWKGLFELKSKPTKEKSFETNR